MVLTVKRKIMIRRNQGIICLIILFVLTGCASPKPKQVKRKSSPTQIENATKIASKYTPKQS